MSNHDNLFNHRTPAQLQSIQNKLLHHQPDLLFIPTTEPIPMTAEMMLRLLKIVHAVLPRNIVARRIEGHSDTDTWPTRSSIQEERVQRFPLEQTLSVESDVDHRRSHLQPLTVR